VKVEVGGKEIKCPSSIPLDSGLTYEIITYIEMLRIYLNQGEDSWTDLLCPHITYTLNQVINMK
jgi:hypothetical protein